MVTIFVWSCLLAALIEPCMSDMYMHFPPGSNNRLNGNQDNVRNANRLFDSQVGHHYARCIMFYPGYFSLALLAPLGRDTSLPVLAPGKPLTRNIYLYQRILRTVIARNLFMPHVWQSADTRMGNFVRRGSGTV